MSKRKSIAPSTLWLNSIFIPHNGKNRCSYSIGAKECGHLYSITTSTGVLADHLVDHCSHKMGDWRDLGDQLKLHYPTKYNAMESKRVKLSSSTSDPSQRTLRESSAPLLNQAYHKSVASWIADCSLPHAIVSRDSYKHMMDCYRAATCKPPSRARIVPLLASCRGSLLDQLKQRLRVQSLLCPVTLCFDGYDNIRRMHVINVMLLCQGQAYFWCSIVNQYGKADAETIADELGKELITLQEAGIIIGAINADNASVNKATHNILRDRFPAILYLPCAAHALQLCIRRVFATNPRALDARKTSKQLITHILRSKAMRTELRLAQEREVTAGRRERVVGVIRPNKTRWSSDYKAFDRLIDLKATIIWVLNTTGSSFHLTEAYWSNVLMLSEFLKPFMIATDIIQSDSAGLIDVYMQFDGLLKHSQAAVSSNSISVSVAASMVGALKMYWSRHIHQQSVLASINLSFTDVPESELFGTRALRGWRRWLLDWGTKFLLTHKLRFKELAKLNDESVTDRFHTQLNAFRERIHPFEEFDSQIQQSLESQSNASSNPVFYSHDARLYWLDSIPLAAELSYVALVLLSINCSEASVERSFSAQGDCHTKKRGSLLDVNVEHQIFVKLNELALQHKNIRRPLVKMRKSALLVVESSGSSASEHKDSDDEELEETERIIWDGDLGELDDEPAEDDDDDDQFGNLTEDDDDDDNEQEDGPSWSYVPSVTAEWDTFCQGFIIRNKLVVDRTWSCRGLTTLLENEMRAHLVMQKEQLSDVKQHIGKLLAAQQ